MGRKPGRRLETLAVGLPLWAAESVRVAADAAGETPSAVIRAAVLAYLNADQASALRAAVDAHKNKEGAK